MIAVFGFSVKLRVIESRSLLPPGVVRSKLSLSFEAVTRLPMVKLPTEPTPPGAMVEAPEPAGLRPRSSRRRSGHWPVSRR